MTTSVIKVSNLGKLYRIGQTIRHDTLRDAISDFFTKPFKHRKVDRKNYNETIWALKDISFEVKRGEVVGIIGRNGSGKTTLLKILSRITEPTEGRAEIYGRVASLLEVGTGFHLELTGRENVFLNGAILGMSKREIKNKFDEIVAFAEVEKFIDTPVKRYSTGMSVRLAFAVAAHLEPEILLVDEVLAVGDAGFQRKSLGKMTNVAKEGRTILFVSHNMAAINRLCARVVWLDKGQVKMIGSANSVVSAYLSSGSEAEGERRWENLEEAPGNEKIRLRSVRVLNSDRKVSATIDIQQPFYIEIEYEVIQVLSSVRVNFRLIAGDGGVVFTSADSNDSSWEGKTRYPGMYVSCCEVPGNFLNEGQYTLTVSADIPFVEILFFEENVLSFHVEQTGGVSGRFSERWPGVICPALPWYIMKC